MSAFLLATVIALSPPEPVDATPDQREEEPVDGTEPAASSEPEPVGCTKDTDCKGDRICDATSGRCQDPAPEIATGTAPTEPAPVPQVRDDPPPTWYRSAPVRTHHPYVAGGVTMIVLGVAGIGTGGAILGIYKGKLDAAANEANTMLGSSSATDEYAEISARGPKVNAGAGILISSGAVLLITGIILAAIEQPVRVAVSPSAGGLEIRF